MPVGILRIIPSPSTHETHSLFGHKPVVDLESMKQTHRLTNSTTEVMTCRHGIGFKYNKNLKMTSLIN